MQLNVLLIEDSADDAALVMRELSKAGFEPIVTRVVNGPAMRLALGKIPVDLIISDHNLPEFDSLSALGIAREAGLDVPFIIVSAAIGEDLAVAAMKSGAHDYVMKSHLKRLAPAVERELRESGVRRAMRQAEADRSRAEQELAFQNKFVAMGRMAASIAHEVNTPLTVVMGTARALVRLGEESQLDAAEITRLGRTIATMSNQIAAIVRGLGTLSRASDRDPLVVSELAAIVAGTLAISTGRFRASRIELTFGAVPPEARILCRPSEIAQILVNLLNNAHDAVESLERRWVCVDFEVRDDRVLIAVTDSGDGIPKDLRGKLMTEFFTTKATGRGTGLGLFLSRRLALEHGGGLTLDASSPHTRFVLALPKAAKPIST